MMRIELLTAPGSRASIRRSQWDWPLAVGKSWERRYRYTDHERGQSREVQVQCRVEAYEEMDVPAGPFKTYRVAIEAADMTVVDWWTPEIGLTVRSVLVAGDL